MEGLCEMDQKLKFNEPWILQRADPYIYRHTDGMYYFTASVPAYDRIVLRRSSTLAGIADAEEVTIWLKHDTGIMSKHIWAPEMHYLEVKWYIYFAAGEAENIWNIRPYVLEGDPLYNPNRHTMLMKFDWIDGRPVFSYKTSV